MCQTANMADGWSSPLRPIASSMPPPLRLLAQPPWHFRLAKWMIRHGIVGGYRLVEAAERMRWLDVVVRYRVAEGYWLDVPLHRRETQWDATLLAQYEHDLLEAVEAAAARIDGPLHLVDCGADIGTFSVLLAARLASRRPLGRITALEPNGAILPILDTNLARLPLETACRVEAVGETSGRGELEFPPYDPASTHARYVAGRDDGSVAVITIDSLGIAPPWSLILKLDVEGGELAALRGAVETLRRVPQFVLAIEAHHHVVERTGIDPCESLRLIEALRPCRAIVAERPDQVLDSRRAFFDQVRPPGIYNMVCWSLPAPIHNEPHQQ